MSQKPQENKMALNVAYFLRNHATLKQRQGQFNAAIVEFFRLKRAVRALLSDEYKAKASNPKNYLPQITSEQQAKGVFALLINNRLVLRGQKLHTKEAREQNLAPKKGFPVFVGLPKAELTDDEYYIWVYRKTSIWDSLMTFGLVAAVFTVICFPLWPMFMRRGVWYLSVALLGLLGLLFVLAIIRLILFIITYFLVSPGIWLFPNLFEDVSFIESFKPLYAWNEPKQKKAKSKSKSTTQGPAATPIAALPKNEVATGASTSSGSAPTKRRVVLEEVDE